jgi:redox-sensitive bicupin YhaK (pirin superfamily)
MHSHANFEIFSYPLSGALMHKDSMNHKEVIRRGAVQHTSAGTGLAHSEYNASETEPVHFLQVWIKPHTRNLEPAYQTVEWSDADKTNKLCLILSDDKESGAIKLNAHAQVYASILEKDKEVTHQIPEGRNGYIHLAQTGGSLEVNGQVLEGGDAVFVYGPLNLKVKSTSDKPAEFLLFNLPPQ